MRFVSQVMHSCEFMNSGISRCKHALTNILLTSLTSDLQMRDKRSKDAMSA